MVIGKGDDRKRKYGETKKEYIEEVKHKWLAGLHNSIVSSSVTSVIMTIAALFHLLDCMI